ncbi:hypothetical protein ACHWQZ_G012886 [Mnemiopsis leidyi]
MMSETSEVGEGTPLLAPHNSEVEREAGTPKTDQIRLFSCISVALSMMTGVGIFIFPNLVLQDVQSGGASLLIWTSAGFIALLAGLCYSELSTALPGSGGELVYIQNVFGRAPANLFLLTSAFVKYPAITIIMTRTSFTYFLKCFTDFSLESSPYEFVLSLAGVFIVLIACLMACCSTRLCTVAINALNFCKLLGILLILSFAIYVGVTAPDKAEIADRFSLRNTTTHAPTLLISLFGAIASYEGWNSLNLVAGEVDNPHYTMPLAITIATCSAIVFYLSCNVAYLTVLPLDVMKTSTAVALDLGRIALGRCGTVLLSVCVVASCLATVLGLVLCNSRLLQRAARDGQIPEVFKFTLNRTATPLLSVILHVPVLIPMFLILFSVILMIAPALTSVGKYRSSFTITIILLAILTPISVISTLPSLHRHGSPLSQTSNKLTRYVESSGSFS